MRLCVQGCLVLLLCFSSSSLFAAPRPAGAVEYDMCGWVPGAHTEASECGNLATVSECHADHPDKYCFTAYYDYGTQWRYKGVFYRERTAEDCIAPNYFDPETNECVTPQEPAECYENGLSYDNQTQQCVEVCEHGVLNDVCLSPPADNPDECTPETEGYKGYFDYGSSRINVCDTDNTCPGGVIGLVGEELKCVPNEWAPPKCKGEEVLHVSDFGGTYCALPNDAPEKTEEPNTDTDGDGEPDEYRRENDPESLDKGLDKVTDQLAKNNDKLDGSNSRLSAIYNRLGTIREGIQDGNNANEGDGAALEQGISTDIGDAGDSATGQLDDHIDGIDTTAPMTADDLSGVESTVSNLFGVSTQCTDIVFGTQELFYTITCQQMDKIRDLLGFLLYGFTVIRLFQIAVRPAAKGTP